MLPKLSAKERFPTHPHTHTHAFSQFFALLKHKSISTPKTVNNSFDLK
jgi:hypothetical protein